MVIYVLRRWPLIVLQRLNLQCVIEALKPKRKGVSNRLSRCYSNSFVPWRRLLHTTSLTMELWQQFLHTKFCKVEQKKTCVRSRATLNFRKFEMDPKPHSLSNVWNFAKTGISTCSSQFDKKKKNMFLNCKHLKLKLWVFWTDYVVAMIPYYAIKMTTTISLMIGHSCNTDIVTSLDNVYWYWCFKVWLLESAQWKLFPATSAQ